MVIQYLTSYVGVQCTERCNTHQRSQLDQKDNPLNWPERGYILAIVYIRGIEECFISPQFLTPPYINIHLNSHGGQRVCFLTFWLGYATCLANGMLLNMIWIEAFKIPAWLGSPFSHAVLQQIVVFFQGRWETCGAEGAHPWLNQSKLSCPAGSRGRNKCLLLYATEFGVVFYAAKLWLQLTDTTCWNWGSESLSDLFKDTKLVNGKARILTQVFLTLINAQALPIKSKIYLFILNQCLPTCFSDTDT